MLVKSSHHGGWKQELRTGRNRPLGGSHISEKRLTLQASNKTTNHQLNNGQKAGADMSPAEILGWEVSNRRSPVLLAIGVAFAHLPSHVWCFATPQTAACQASLSLTIFQSWLKFMSIESVMLSNHLILCCPLLPLPVLQSIPASGSFSNESALYVRWPQYWSLNVSTSNEYSGLISFRIDWFVAVQGTLKGFL